MPPVCQATRCARRLRVGGSELPTVRSAGYNLHRLGHRDSLLATSSVAAPGPFCLMRYRQRLLGYILFGTALRVRLCPPRSRAEARAFVQYARRANHWRFCTIHGVISGKIFVHRIGPHKVTLGSTIGHRNHSKSFVAAAHQAEHTSFTC
jgi:hypothetical protein